MCVCVCGFRIFPSDVPLAELSQFFIHVTNHDPNQTIPIKDGSRFGTEIPAIWRCNGIQLIITLSYNKKKKKPHKLILGIRNELIRQDIEHTEWTNLAPNYSTYDMKKPAPSPIPFGVPKGIRLPRALSMYLNEPRILLHILMRSYERARLGQDPVTNFHKFP